MHLNFQRPCLIGFNAIDDVIAGYDFFALVVDKTLALDVLRL